MSIILLDILQIVILIPQIWWLIRSIKRRNKIENYSGVEASMERMDRDAINSLLLMLVIGQIILFVLNNFK